MIRSPVSPWLWLAPLAGWMLLAVALVVRHPAFALLEGAGLIACVLAAVHHAEVVAHRVGEPFGTLLLALAVTVIEVALIVSLMLTGGPATAALARDTVFASIMIILNGMVGVCLMLGASRHGEQSFGLYGVNATLAALAAVSVITLVLPNATTSTPGPAIRSVNWLSSPSFRSRSTAFSCWCRPSVTVTIFSRSGICACRDRACAAAQQRRDRRQRHSPHRLSLRGDIAGQGAGTGDRGGR